MVCPLLFSRSRTGSDDALLEAQDLLGAGLVLAGALRQQRQSRLLAAGGQRPTGKHEGNEMTALHRVLPPLAFGLGM